MNQLKQSRYYFVPSVFSSVHYPVHFSETRSIDVSNMDQNTIFHIKYWINDHTPVVCTSASTIKLIQKVYWNTLVLLIYWNRNIIDILNTTKMYKPSWNTIGAQKIFFNMASSPFGDVHVESENESVPDGVKASLFCKLGARCPFTVGLSDQLGNLEFKCVFFMKMSLEV